MVHLLNTRLKKNLLSAFTLMSAVVSSQAFATNGYFTHGVTIAEKSMGGAGAAMPTSSLSVDINPASLVDVGDNLDLLVTLFSPKREYSVTGAPSAPAGTTCGASCPFSIGDGSQSIESGRNYFILPTIGYSKKINDKSAWGIAMIARGGMNTEWSGGNATLAPAGTTVELPGTYGDGTASSDLKQLYIKGSYSYSVNNTLDIGAALMYIYQGLEITGLGNFAGYSSSPQNISDNGVDYSSGIGIKVGALLNITDNFHLGFSYQPKVDMSEFSEYSGLLAEGGDFDFPENYVLGLSWNIKNNHNFVFDIQQINYSDIASLGNGISPLTTGQCAPGPSGGTGLGCLGASNGAGFGWEDMTIYKFGYQIPSGENLLRFGYSYTDQPIPESETLFNILAPAVIEQHFTAGYSMKSADNKGWEFSFTYALGEAVKGRNPFDSGPDGVSGQEIELDMDQWEFSAGYSF
ncbi:MAG: outer membrane protein transport protein [Agarilytica sp.]